MGTSVFTYTTDAGNFFKVRMNDDDVLADVRGESASGALTENMTLKISKNQREVGGQPRYCKFAREIKASTDDSGGGTTSCLSDTAYKYMDVVSLTTTAWDAVDTGTVGGDSPGTTFTYQGKEWYCVTKTEEVMR